MKRYDMDQVTLRECIRLARQDPDESLLRKYYLSHTANGERNSTLTANEIRWVQANLAGNPRWQRSYDRIRNMGPALRLSRSYALRFIAAAVIAISAPVWILAVYDSGGPDGRTIRVAHGDASDVIRGGTKPSLRLPDNFTSFLSPSFTTLRDLRTSRRGTAQMRQLRDDLAARYTISQNRVERAEIALVAAQISHELRDQPGVEAWRERCRAEHAFDCTVLRLRVQ